MATGSQTSTTLPSPYIQDLLTREGSGLFPQLSASLETPFQQYGGPRVAGFSADQLAAMQRARDSVGATDVQEQRAADLMSQSQQALTGGGQQAQSLLDQSVNSGRNWLNRALGQTQQMSQQGNPLYNQALNLSNRSVDTGSGWLSQALGQARGIADQGNPLYNEAIDLSNRSVGAGTGWLSQALEQAQGLADQGNPLFDQSRQMTDQAMAESAPWMDQALRQTQNLAQQGNPLFSQSQDMIEQSAQGPTASGLQQYMDPYQQSVIDTTMSELNRQDDIAQQGRNAQAVGAGAFGGSRHGVMEAEAGRNLTDVKARTLAQLNSQNFGQAMNTFQNQQGRQAQAGQALGSLGAQQFGAKSGAAGQLADTARGAAGLKLGAAGQQAGLGAQQSGIRQNALSQLMSGGQGLSSIYGSAAGQQAGLGAQQSGIRQNALGQMMSGGQGLSGIYGSAAGQQAGLGAQQFGAQQSALDQMMSGGQGLSGIYGSAAGQQAGLAGQQASGLGDLARQQLGLGSFVREQDIADINNLYGMGQRQQAQRQAGLDIGYQNFLQRRQYEDPRSKVSFMSDIIRGAPSGSQTMSQTYTPPPSPLQTIAGLAPLAMAFI